MSLRGQASWTKMMSLRRKLTTLACHPTKFVNKAEKRTFLPRNIGPMHKLQFIRVLNPGGGCMHTRHERDYFLVTNKWDGTVGKSVITKISSINTGFENLV